MELIIRAENESDEKLLKAKEVGFKNADAILYIVKYKEAGVIEKDYSWSFGNLSWLLGRLYVALKALERLFISGAN